MSRHISWTSGSCSSSAVFPEALAAEIVLWLMHPLGLSTPGLAVLCILTRCGFLQRSLCVARSFLAEGWERHLRWA